MIAGGTTNSYEVVAKLATGGMAEVFLARVTSEVSIERYVVLKRVLPEYASDPAFVTMFLDEARLAAQLRHPNIAQLYDVGRIGNSYFYTMEYVHGATTWHVMERANTTKAPIPIALVLTIAGGVSAALHHAHTRVGADRKPLGIVHRDVSPANIMVSSEGVVKLLDFGVAKAQGRRTVTLAGHIKGKIAYLSPEQITPGSTIDGRSDIFALGTCLYELLTLHQLFQRQGDLPTMNAIVNDTVPPPSTIRPDIPPEIDRLVMTALAKDPAQRFETADAMHTAVEDTATAIGVSTSVTALARFMSYTFGNPPEPWLELEPPAAANAVTVIAAPLAAIDTTVPVPKIPEARDSAELDERIKAMRPQRRSQPRFDSFDESTDVEDNPGSSRPSLPLATQHPSWEQNTQPAVVPLDPADRTAPEPRTAFEDDGPSDIQTIVAPKKAPTGPHAPLSSALPLERPVIQRSITPGPMLPSTAAWPTAPAQWNVPRLVIAGVLLVAIIVAIVLMIR